MKIALTCKQCGKQFAVSDQFAGRRAKCPCGATLIVPGVRRDAEPRQTAVPAATPKSQAVARPLEPEPDPASIDPGAWAAEAAPVAPLSAGRRPTAQPAGSGARQSGIPAIKISAAIAALGFAVFLALLLWPALAALWAGLCILAALAMIAVGIVWLWRITLRRLPIIEIIGIYLNPFACYRFYRDHWRELRRPFWMTMIALGMFIGAQLGRLGVVLWVAVRVVADAGHSVSKGPMPQPTPALPRFVRPAPAATRPAASLSRPSPQPAVATLPVRVQAAPRLAKAELPEGHSTTIDMSAPNVWNVQVDPSSPAMRISPKLALPLLVPSPKTGSIAYIKSVYCPATCTQFVGVGAPLGDVAVWDCASMNRIGTIEGPFAATMAFDFALSPDGKWLAGGLGSENPAEEAQPGEEPNRRSVRLWSVGSGQPVIDLPPPSGAKYKSYMAFLGPDRLLVCYEHVAWIWQLPAGRLEREIVMRTAANGIRLSPGGRYLLDWIPRDPLVVDLRSGQLAGVWRLPKTPERPMSMCLGASFSPDGRKLAAILDRGRSALDSDKSSDLIVRDVERGEDVLQHQADRSWSDHLGVFVNGIEWLSDNQGWLISGAAAIERSSNRVVWKIAKPPVFHRLAGGDQLLAAWQSAGEGLPLAGYLVVHPVSLGKPPDFVNDPAAREVERLKGSKDPP